MNIITKINNKLYKFKDNKKYRKFKNCSIPYPFYDKKRNTFEWVKYSKDDKIFYKKISLLDAFEDNIRYGVIYHYKAKLPIRENNKYHLTTCHCHQFDEVIKALYDYPESFEIPNDYLEEYSKQELEYLNQ